jgi:hypothetical protein
VLQTRLGNNYSKLTERRNVANLIKVDGSETEIHPKNGKTFSLEELQGFVGGYIERIKLPNGDSIFLDEEGKLKQKPRNERATLMGRVCGIAHTDFVVGDVVVCNPVECGDGEP